MLISLKHILSACLYILLLTACSTAPKQKADKLIAIEKPTSPISAEQLLNQAYTSQDPQIKASLLLKAAHAYCKNNLIAQCSAVLNELNYSKLSAQELITALELNLELGINHDLDNHTSIASRIYPITPLDKSSMTSVSKIIPMLAQALTKENNPLDSAILLIEYEGVLDDQDKAELNNIIWHNLRSVDPITLNSYVHTNNNPITLAWLNLIKTIQQNQLSIEKQFSAYSQWKQLWPNHPASILPPSELQLLSKLPETKPERIILALPLSGPVSEVGKSVRDGFVAAYIHDRNLNSNQEMSISFFDTHKQNLEELYQQDLPDNTLIIGPLIKSDVNKLAKLDTTQHRTLALNYLDTSASMVSTPNSRLYQFGLDPETEISQLSRLFSKKKLNKIAYIAPDNEHGYRIHDSLEKALSEFQSIIIESVYYQNQKSLSPSVAQLLATDQSKLRKDKIQRLTQLSMEFEPRRRKDIDAIFMVAKPNIASQLKPLFAYHFVRDLPIYASSQIHEPRELQHDLDQILFVEMPWMLSQSISIKNTINHAISQTRNDYSRFYALGADAYKLAPRLKLLKEIQGTQIQGHTGILSITENGIVQRELQLASIKKGKAVPVKD